MPMYAITKTPDGMSELCQNSVFFGGDHSKNIFKQRRVGATRSSEPGKSPNLAGKTGKSSN